MRNIFPPFSWSKSGPSNKPAVSSWQVVFSEIFFFEISTGLYQTTRRYVQEDRTLDCYNISSKLSKIQELPPRHHVERCTYSIQFLLEYCYYCCCCCCWFSTANTRISQVFPTCQTFAVDWSWVGLVLIRSHSCVLPLSTNFLVLWMWFQSIPPKFWKYYEPSFPYH
jgi:hypothetical protein